MKTIRVAAAVIEKDGRIMIAKRSYGEQAGLWEFPGGKYEKDEKGEETIVREIREEFDARIAVDGFLCRIEHDYDSFHLLMDCYICHFLSDEVILHDHSDLKWIDPFDEDVEWVPADRKVIAEYRKRRCSYEQI